MRSRLRPKKRFFYLPLGILILFGAYLYTGIFPFGFKQKPIQWIESSLGLKTDFKRMHYLPFVGVFLDGVKITDPKNNIQTSIKHLYVKTDFKLLWQNNEIHLPLIRLKDVDIKLLSGNDNGGVVFDNKPKTNPALGLAFVNPRNLPSNVYLKDIVVSGATIPIPGFTTLTDVYLKTHVDEWPKIPLKLRSRTDMSDSPIQIQGMFDAKTGGFEGYAKGKVTETPLWLEKLLLTRGITLNALKADFKIYSSIQNQDQMAFEIFADETKLDGSWKNYSTEADIKIHTKLFTLDGLNTFNLTEGELAVQHGKLLNTNNPTIWFQNLKTDVVWDKEWIHLNHFTGSWFDSSIYLSGILARDPEELMDLTFIQSANSLERWKTFFPDYFNSDWNLDSLRGQLTLSLKLKGPLKKWEKNIESVELLVAQGELKPHYLGKPIEGLDGKITLKEQNFIFEDVSFFYEKQPFRLEGFLDPEVKQSSTFQLIHPEVTTRGEFYPREEKTEIKSLLFSSGESSLNLKGDWQLKENGMPLNLEGNLKLDLLDLKNRHKTRWPWLESFNLTGSLDAAVQLKGPITDLSQIYLDMKSTSPLLSIWGFQFKDSEMDLRLQNHILQVSYLKSWLYDGEFRGSFNLNTKDLDFELKTFSHDIDLEKMKKDVSWIPEDLEGMLGFDITLNGLWGKKESFTGFGNFQSQGNNLWSTTLFHELRDLPFLTLEGMEFISFHEASGSFVIENKAFLTEDTVLSSNLIRIHVLGQVGFDKSLDLNINSRFSPSLIRKGLEMGGLAPSIMNMAELEITEYTASGTLDDPKFIASSS